MRLESRISAGALLIAGLTGFLASFILTIDKFKVLKDAGFTPSCNINASINCKSVMLSEQAEVFGFPNSLIGIATFAIMIALSVAMFMRVEFPKLFWQLVVLGTALAVVFCHWLAFQTIFEIGALCPYCMVAWFATLLVLAVGLRELLEIKRVSLVEQDSKIDVETIKKWMLPFHLLWSGILLGSAFLGV